MKKNLFVTFSILCYLTSQCQIITTVAGGMGNGIQAIYTPVNQPFYLAIDASRNIYFSDYYNHRIRKFNVNSGLISTIGGNRIPGNSGDGGAAISANLNNPVGIAIDNLGNLYIADRNNYKIRKVNVSSGIITTVAGNGISGFGGDGGSATSANLNNLTNIAVDSYGNFYFSDDHRIRKVNASTGIISTVAGNGISGFGGDGGAATAANLNSPHGIAIDDLGNLYIADYNNNEIRKVNANTGLITTVAGSLTNGLAGSGDGGAATSANLNNPTGVAVDNSGNIYIADYNNHKIRKVNASNGIISTVAGDGAWSSGGDGGVATSASFDHPSAVLVDSSGNLYITDYLNNRIRKVNASSGIITTIIGNGTQGYGGDGAAAISAFLYSPNGTTVDGFGNLYIADQGNQRIRKVNASTGIMSTVAGIGVKSYGGDGYAANAAKLNNPQGVAFDGSGNLFIADFFNHCIRKVNSSSGNISTIVGNGMNGYAGDGAAAIAARLNRPTDIAIDGSGNLYIVDCYNQRIRKINSSTGIISTIAGNGTIGYGGDGVSSTATSLSYPTGIAIDESGNVYIADQNNHRIRKINASTGIISTVAGNGTSGFGGDGGQATVANLNYPSGLDVDGSGNLYIADYGNHRIRKVNASNGIISTIVGNGTMGYSGDSAVATAAILYYPTNVNLDGSGNLYISDAGNHKIRKVFYGVYNNNISSNQTVCLGKNPDSLIATIPLGGTGTYNYIWLKSTIGPNVGFSAVPASNTVGYKPSVLTQNTWFKRSVVSGSYIDTSASILVTVNPNPYPSVGFTINHSTQCVNGNNFSFTDTSTISAGTITRKWNFGTGVNDTSLLVNPNKIYSSANIYAVKLIISSNNGCKDSVTKTITVNPKPVVDFTAPTLFCLSNSNISFNLINNSSISTGSLNYNWQFGDNTSSNLLNPIKTISDSGNLVIKLIATSNNNCKDSITKTTLVNFKPNAGFTINNPIQCIIGNSFLFTDTSTIAGGTITRKWNFGTGNNDTSLLASSTKVYSTANSYVVKLITTSYNGCKDSITKNVSVIAKPTVNFAINNQSQCLKNNNFIFTNQSTLGFNYLWKFGNGDSSVIVSPNYSYANVGTNAVKLIVSSNNNCKDSITKNIVVNANSIANFTINNDTQNFVGNNFVFTNTSTNSNSQLWNLGDSTSATILNPTKIYSSFGTKTVQLISNNAGNCYDTISKSIFVNANPTIGNILGNINPTSTINPYSYSVLSQSNVAYNWSVQNGIIQNGQGTNAVSVIWSNKGIGNIFAKITNGYNLSDSTNLAVNITTVGINNLSLDNDLKVYPNPTKTSITITNKTNLTGKKYIITNLVGQTVLSGKLNLDETIVNLESLQSGMYFLSIDGLNKQSIKVIKE